MKIRLRALNQDDQNVQKGESLLNVASGAIQSQINLLRTVKERVINANNDTNTDADRAIIQKEINQCYDEIDTIYADTEFNSKKILMGNTVAKKISSWVVTDKAQLVEGSDALHLVPDNYDTLDGQEGPFDTFGKTKAEDSTEVVDYDGYKVKNIAAETLTGSTQTTNKFHDAGPNTARIMEVDLSKAGSTVDSLNNTSFYIETPASYDYMVILSKTPGNNYKTLNYKTSNLIVDISSCSSLSDVANAINTKLNSTSGITSYYTVAADGSKISLTTKIDGTTVNSTSSYNISQAKVNGGTETTYSGGTSGSPGSPEIPERTGASPTGLISGTQKLSGGANEVTHNEEIGGHWEYKVPGDDDSKTWIKDYKKVVDSPAKAASTTVNGISGVASGTGITINGSSGSYYVTFADGSSGPSKTYSDGLANSDRFYTIGKNYTGTWNINGMTITFKDGNMTLTANGTGSYGNSYGVEDGFATIPKKDAVPATPSTPGTPETKTYTETTALAGAALNNMKQAGADGAKAHWDIDLSSYTGSVDDLISSYVGKSINASGYTASYEFIDTGSDNKMDAIPKSPTMLPYNGTSPGSTISSNTIDLNKVRTLVKGGKTIAEAFSTVVKNATGSSTELIHADPADPTSAITGIKFLASVAGVAGNNQTMSATEGELRQYTLDFSGITGMPASLNEQGFRFYCATDDAQWVNVYMYNGADAIDTDKPASGTAALDIKTLMVDVSSVTDAKSLVKLLDEKLGDYLVNTYQHNFLLASDSENGTLTIYDKRRFTVMNKNYYGSKQEKGAKIADGVMDNVVKDTRNIYSNRLIIHHTDVSSNNITIDIPQTSLDQIFGFKKENYGMEHFSIMTRDMREQLLGVPPDKGILDKGIEYLTDAQTLIGAQINHLRFADQNIITQNEAVTAAESVIRDTDMAQSMIEYTKHNILSQASQSMLAQANQNASNAINLLQG